MKLNKVIIEGYRCFKEKVEVIIDDDTTALVGTNSGGKTAFLSAILKILSDSQSDRIIKKTDFFVDKSVNIHDFNCKKMYIELQFIFSELKQDGFSNDAIPVFFRKMVVNTPGGVPYVRICLKSEWTKGTTIDGNIESKIVYLDINGNEKGNVSRNDLNKIRVLYIPALRDIEKEIKYVSGTLIQRLLNLVKIDDQKKEEIKNSSKALNDVVLNDQSVVIINEILNSNWSNFNLDERFKELSMEFSTSEAVEIFKKSMLTFKPGIDYNNFELSELGDGSKSVLYFTLVSSLIETEKELIANNLNDGLKLPIHTIILVEEPENHVAPHMFGQLINSIMSTSQKSAGQVLLSTHSPAIINRIDPEKLRLFRINNYSSIVNMINVPQSETVKYKFIKDDFRKNPYIYFSKLVIIVEGDSEQFVIPRFLAANNIDLDMRYISILQLDSRFIEGAWKLLNDLDIPYITFVDLDNGRSCGGYNKIIYLLSALKQSGKIDDINLGNGKLLFEHNIITEMRCWSLNYIDLWINYLKQFDIFLSAPIDLDFMLFGKYKKYYLNTISSNEGPRVKGVGKVIDIEKNKDYENEKYLEKIKIAKEHVLKDNNDGGYFFTCEELRNMIWYDYFFLSNSKPVSHYKAFSYIPDIELTEHIPGSIDELLKRVKQIVGKDGNNN